MGVVQEAVADGVGQGRLAKIVVPLSGRQLARDDRGAAAVAILEDFEEIAPFLILDGGETPVIEDEAIEAGQLGEQADVGAIGAGQREVVEEARGAPIVGAVALAAGLMGERTGQEAFPHTGGADHDDVLVLVDPAAGGELADEGLVELAPGREVDGLDARLGELELGLVESAAQALVLAGEPLRLNQQGEAFIEGEAGQLGGLLLFSPRLGWRAA